MNIRLLKTIDALLGGLLARVLPGRSPAEEKAGPPGSILIIRPGGIGDAILLLPAIRALKAAHPDAAIDVLAEKRNGQAFAFSAGIHQVFRYDGGTELLQVLRNRYDVVIDTEQWHRLSAVVARLIRSPIRIGYATNERQRLFTYAVAYSHDTYEADSFCNLLTPLGIGPTDEPAASFIEITPEAHERAGELLGDLQHRSFVALFPGASIPERRWGTDNFREVVSALAEEGIPSVVIGGGEDVDDGAKIVTDSSRLNLAGRTSLMETAAIIEKSSVLISGDSGILHIGVGLGKPTVSLFGPGIAKKWAPRGADHIVLNRNLPCSPCTRFGYTPKCSEGARCLKEITVDDVIAAVMTLLCGNDVRTVDHGQSISGCS